jgi:hypothetical protein
MIQAPRAILFLGCALLSARTALGSGAQVLTHGQLKPGKIVSAKIGAGRSHVYELPLEAGQFVHLVLYTPGFPVLLNLSSIERKFAGGAGRKESFYWLSDQSNKFRLELSSEEPGKPALFKLELQGLRPATPQDQQRVSGYRALDRARRAIDDHEYKQAVADLEQVVALFQQAADRQLEAETLLNLGIAWDKQYDHQRSAAYFEKSLAIYREIKEPDGEGDALRNLAYQYFDLDQRQKAYEEPLSVWVGSKSGLDVRALRKPSRLPCNSAHTEG